jgi:hypothetical protein
MQGTIDFHHPSAHAFLPQADLVFDSATNGAKVSEKGYFTVELYSSSLSLAWLAA